jgi:ubiquinone/menaquinone biosynthesis C-methylase UbiE
MITMKCLCCESDQIIIQSINFRQYYKCVFCGFTFDLKKACNDLSGTISSYYSNIDPHQRVATSKLHFFRLALHYLSSQGRNIDRSILDVGCGFGYFLELASRNGWNTYGVEIVDSAVEVARKKLGKKNIFHGSLRNAHYPDEYFDAITLWDVLVMVDNPIEELRECYRILKRGGKLGIRVRNADFQKIIYRIYLPLSKVVSAPKIKKPYVFHPYNFTKTSLDLILQRGGFSDIQIINSPLTKGDPYGHSQIRVLTPIIKYTTDILTKTLFQLSRGRLVIGPSLLAWAEKT